MNEMYKYLKDHSYISERKVSNYQFELSEERANCIACKYESLVEELEEENKQLQDNWNKLKEYLKNYDDWIFISTDVAIKIILDEMQELEKSDKQ